MFLSVFFFLNLSLIYQLKKIFTTSLQKFTELQRRKRRNIHCQFCSANLRVLYFDIVIVTVIVIVVVVVVVVVVVAIVVIVFFLSMGGVHFVPFPCTPTRIDLT